MAVEATPFALQANTYSAEITRRSIYALLQRGATVGSVLGGIVGSTDLQVTAGSGMQVSVAVGEAVVAGSSSASQSGYYLRGSSATTLAIATSDPSNPRIDRVSAVIKDASYSGVENIGALAVATGTPTASATLTNLLGVAAAPASSLTLGYVLVPASSVSISNGNIANVAQPLSVGLLGNVVLRNAEYTAAANEKAFVEGTTTVKMPVPKAGVSVMVFNGNAAVGNVTIINTGGGKFYGAYVNAVNSLTLTPLQGVQLEGSGTNWWISAGEAKREAVYSVKKAWTKVEAEAGVEASATRPAIVIFNTSPTGLNIGGVGNLPPSTTVWLNPGQKWGATIAVETSNILL